MRPKITVSFSLHIIVSQKITLAVISPHLTLVHPNITRVFGINMYEILWFDLLYLLLYFGPHVRAASPKRHARTMTKYFWHVVWGTQTVSFVLEKLYYVQNPTMYYKYVECKLLFSSDRDSIAVGKTMLDNAVDTSTLLTSTDIVLPEVKFMSSNS